MGQRDILHLKCLEDLDFTSILECKIDKYEEKLKKILDLCTKLISQRYLNQSCNTNIIDKGKKVLYLTE